MGDERSAVTQVLAAVRHGEPGATTRLYEMVYAELRRMARAGVGRGGAGGPTPTSIVHEAYLRLAGNTKDFESRAHFFGAAAEAMRRILVDRARERQALKRGGTDRPVSLHETAAISGVPPVELIDVNRALSRLQAKDAQMATVVKLRYFAGLTVPETAEALGISARSVNRNWTVARAWLLREMKLDRAEE